MLLNLLIGRALMRWLERMAPEPDAPAATEAAPEPAAQPEAEPEPAPAPEMVYPRLQRRAMGSLFEVYLAGTDRAALEGAAEMALDEVERLERQLSHYSDESDIARLNRYAPEQWVRLEPRLYQLLKHCYALSMETGGAFDITAGPLVKAWGFYRGEGRVPPDDEIAALLENVGVYRILFDDEDHLVYFTAPKLEINLGAIGKGVAIDAAVETLRFFNIQSAVVHGGQSTIYALGEPPPAEDAEDNETMRQGEGETGEGSGQGPSTVNPQPSTGWVFHIRDPRDRETVLETVYLRDEAISTSGSYEQFFEMDGVRYSHILDPRTGRPVHGLLSVSVIAPSAADSDALSTAFFVMGPEETEEYCRAHPNLRVIMVAERTDDSVEVIKMGFSIFDFRFSIERTLIENRKSKIENREAGS